MLNEKNNWERMPLKKCSTNKQQKTMVDIYGRCRITIFRVLLLEVLGNRCTCRYTLSHRGCRTIEVSKWLDVVHPDALRGFIPPIHQGAAAFQPLWAQVFIYSTSPLLPLTAQPEPSASHGEAPLPPRQAKRSFCPRLAKIEKNTEQN